MLPLTLSPGSGQMPRRSSGRPMHWALLILTFPGPSETHSLFDPLSPHTSRTPRSPGSSCSSGHLHSSGGPFIPLLLVPLYPPGLNVEHATFISLLLVPLYLPGLNVEHARTLSTCVPCSGDLMWLWVSCRCGLPSLHPTGASRLNSRHIHPLACATCSLGEVQGIYTYHV